MMEAHDMLPGGKAPHAASASASAKNEASREVAYTMPSMTKPEAAPPPVALAPSAIAQPTEVVDRPREHTLARGRYESKPAVIYGVSVGAVAFALAWIAMRVRRSNLEKKRAAELRRSLPRATSTS
jgi:hypothetical protein